MTRREMLKYAAGTVGAVVVAGGIGVLGRQSGGSARAAVGPPLEILQTFTLNGRRVQLGQRGAARGVMLLDGRELSEHAFVRLGPRKFSSHMLPFEDFNSGRELAQALIVGEARGLYRLT